MIPFRIAAVGIVSALVAGCSPPHDMETQWTPYRRYYQLKERPEDCRAYVAYDGQGIPSHVPIATLSTTMTGGLMGTTTEQVIDEFRRQTCRIGGDGVIIPEESRKQSYWGGVANATVFMWARPSAGGAPLPPSAPPTAACQPACRAGFVCQAGSCVSACNPPCPEGERCQGVGVQARCEAP